ncbi:uncharacterized protein LOC100216003 [Oryzias latipes]|nr:uncharacterized protein LOC100216003 [Oryzias latipes]
MDHSALVLVSAVLYLCNLTACAPRGHQPNLKDIISVIDKYNDTTSQFVEDVQDLADADGCKDEFFCTVHGVLKNRGNLKPKKSEQEQIVIRNLAVFIKTSEMKCENKPKTNGNKVPITTLLGFLQDCCKRRLSFGKPNA